VQSNTVRAVIGVGLIAVAVALFIVLRDEDSDSGSTREDTAVTSSAATSPAADTIEFRDGEPVGGVKEIEATAGETVRFRVNSDVEGEVHVHGYEVEKPIDAGSTVGFDFPADIEGQFEIEIHLPDREPQIGVLAVNP
jgi:hypothetical protein